jgi:hypothetical protein
MLDEIARFDHPALAGTGHAATPADLRQHRLFWGLVLGHRCREQYADIDIQASRDAHHLVIIESHPPGFHLRQSRNRKAGMLAELSQRPKAIGAQRAQHFSWMVGRNPGWSIFHIGNC